MTPLTDPLLTPSAASGVYVHLTWNQINALLEALNTGSQEPPIVGDLAAYYLAVEKLEQARSEAQRGR